MTHSERKLIEKREKKIHRLIIPVTDIILYLSVDIYQFICLHQ